MEGRKEGMMGRRKKGRKEERRKGRKEPWKEGRGEGGRKNGTKRWREVGRVDGREGRKEEQNGRLVEGCWSDLQSKLNTCYLCIATAVLYAVVFLFPECFYVHFTI